MTEHNKKIITREEKIMILTQISEDERATARDRKKALSLLRRAGALKEAGHDGAATKNQER